MRRLLAALTAIPCAAAAQSERLTAAETEAIRQSPVTRLVEQELGGTIVGMQREE